jgi:hypothetical protein
MKGPASLPTLSRCDPVPRGHICGSQLEHDLVDLPGGRAGVLLRRGRDRSDRPVWGLNDAVTPQSEEIAKETASRQLAGGGAAIPLIVVCQCAVARRVVAPLRGARQWPGR